MDEDGSGKDGFQKQRRRSTYRRPKQALGKVASVTDPFKTEDKVLHVTRYTLSATEVVEWRHVQPSAVRAGIRDRPAVKPTAALASASEVRWLETRQLCCWSNVQPNIIDRLSFLIQTTRRTPTSRHGSDESYSTSIVRRETLLSPMLSG